MSEPAEASLPVRLCTERILAIGGYGSDRIVRFDRELNKWTSASPIPGIRNFSKATVLGDEIIFTGGLYETGVTRKVGSFNKTSEQYQDFEINFRFSRWTSKRSPCVSCHE